MEDTTRWNKFTFTIQEAADLLYSVKGNLADESFIKYCSSNGEIIRDYLHDYLYSDDIASLLQIKESRDIATILTKFSISLTGIEIDLLSKMALIISLCAQVDGLRDLISQDRPNDLRWIVSAVFTYRQNNFQLEAPLNYLNNPEILNTLYSLRYCLHNGKQVDVDLLVYAIALRSPDLAINWLRILSENENFKPTYNNIEHWMSVYIEMTSDYEKFPNYTFNPKGDEFQVFFNLAKNIGDKEHYSSMKYTSEMAVLATNRLIAQINKIDQLIAKARSNNAQKNYLPDLLECSRNCRLYSEKFVGLFSQFKGCDQQIFSPLLNELALLQQKIQGVEEQKNLIDEKGIPLTAQKLLAILAKEEKLRAISEKEKLFKNSKHKKNKKQSPEKSVSYNDAEYKAAEEAALKIRNALLAELDEEAAKAEKKNKKKKNKKAIEPMKEESAPVVASSVPEPTVKPHMVKNTPIEQKHMANEEADNWQLVTNKKIKNPNKMPNIPIKENKASAAAPAAKTIYPPKPIRAEISSMIDKKVIETKEVEPAPTEVSHSANASASPAVAPKKTLNADAREFIPQEKHSIEQQPWDMPPGLPYHPMPQVFYPYSVPLPYAMPIFPFETAMPVDASYHLASIPATLLHYDLEYYRQLVANAIQSNANKELHEIMKPLPDEIRLNLLKCNEALLIEALEHKFDDVLTAVLDCFNNKALKYEFYICQGIDFAGDNFVSAVKKLNSTDKESMNLLLEHVANK